MKKHSKLYLALDVHARHCVLGRMTEDGRFLGSERFTTSAKLLIDAVKKVKSEEIILTLEEGTLAQWVSDTLRPHVTRLIVCDPRENTLIARSAKKCDEFDVHQLCRLLRLGELKEVYHSDQQDRVVFKRAVQHYLELRDEVTRAKNRLKSKYRGFGVQTIDGKRAYGADRVEFLEQVPSGPKREMVKGHYEVLDVIQQQRDLALSRVMQLGGSYSEIKEFEKIPGIGPVNAHVFSAFIMTPHRFSTVRKLWKYCRLGITDRSSDGKPLGYQRLDRYGNRELKMVSYHAWRSAIATRKDNEVKDYFNAVLERTQNRRHARLSTQRKILSVMWTVWKKEVNYEIELFCGRPSSLREPA